MSKQVSASDAKNNFGGLLESVASLGRVDIVRHGRVVAIVLAPREFDALANVPEAKNSGERRKEHMIPAHLARRARMLHAPVDFDED